jgi:hypothetical protein
MAAVPLAPSRIAGWCDDRGASLAFLFAFSIACWSLSVL